MYVYQTTWRHVLEVVNIYYNETDSSHIGRCVLRHILCTRVIDTSGTSWSPADTRYPVPVNVMKQGTWTWKDTPVIYRIWFLCLFLFFFIKSGQPVCAELLPLMFLTSSQRIKRYLLFCHTHNLFPSACYIYVILYMYLGKSSVKKVACNKLWNIFKPTTVFIHKLLWNPKRYMWKITSMICVTAERLYIFKEKTNISRAT